MNALDLGVFQPWDVGERSGSEIKRLKLSLPFYSAYLITEQNQQNISFNVEEVVPASIAEFIFQKTIGVEHDLQTGQQTESSSIVQSVEKIRNIPTMMESIVLSL